MENKALSAAQYTFLSHYLELLRTVEEGFDFVQKSYSERNFGHGDQLLSDIMSAFVQFNSSNMTMRSVFAQDENLLRQLEQFQSIVDQVANLGQVFEQQDESKVAFVSTQLIPTYQAWKKTVEKTLHKYHQQ